MPKLTEQFSQETRAGLWWAMNDNVPARFGRYPFDAITADFVIARQEQILTREWREPGFPARSLGAYLPAAPDVAGAAGRVRQIK